jgi:hypothetical protein
LRLWNQVEPAHLSMKRKVEVLQVEGPFERKYLQIGYVPACTEPLRGSHNELCEDL